ncbi:Na+/H+ antiporter NhaC family protein [Intestinimonas butyriciproducens]|uniref:Na+/H+ antiporter NhaC family protein n=1 Tax=Intestinimonas butyriciproducens TaxID=1297617 RepID=UPI00051C9057|nr:Na+/H+ antiporter NhaC family protein [Intestinimonas butyriciproducens]MCB7051084.1 Na+/H+ antiporter NhaC family protein [Intestinimonas butyriciproducens]MDB7816556.1 Na+/H+ antiporter NhaC family protein [Intestinimonas butyriciproducens]MDB7842674.1 Na+/H+ antiporter NhaC family protein [Intestinimonas butyriciproducens]MDB7857578.1 Na+/H+ antiporter NhaC family protein [Intestinimonas butyriciproducens]
MQQFKRKIAPVLLVLTAALGLLLTTAFAEGEAEYVSSFYSSALSLLPPVVAIGLSLITKEVYTSLFLGCLVGGFLYANFNPVLAVTSTFDTLCTAVGGNLGIVAFLVILGIIVVLMNRSGGSKAYGDWAKKKIKTKRGALLATMVLAIVLGVDDYFNNLTTGNVMRPVTDSHNISRAKLAYMCDATAAPVCIMMPISSWAAAVSGVADTMEGVSGLQLFISAIPWNYYALLTLFMLVVLAVFDLDYGPMKVHEDNAKKGDLYTTPERPYANADDSKNSTNGKVTDLVIPVIILIIFCVTGLLYTGGMFEGGISVIDAFSNCDAPTGLMYGSFLALVLIFAFYMIRRTMTFHQFTDCIAEGFNIMVPAILILTFAWTISDVTNGLLGAKYFVADAMASVAGSFANLLPAVIFLVACGLGFATGTSWGTFGILIPIVVSTFGADAGTILTIGIASCLAGAVMGDHCSPISDTTILASTGAQCYHLNHVKTQIPYAVTVAAVAFVNYIIAGYLQNVIIDLIIAFASMFGVLVIIRMVEQKKQPAAVKN